MGKRVIRKNKTENCEIVNMETGEIIRGQGDSYRVILEDIYYDDDNGDNDEMINFRTEDYFFKLFKGNGIILFNELEATEIALLVALTEFISYDDCALRKGGRRNGALLTIEDIARYTKMPVETLKKTFYGLMSKEVIGSHRYADDRRKKWYSVNPFVILKGTRITKRIYNFYSKTRWAELANIVEEMNIPE